MASAREMRLRIRSVRNISQVTRALETVSASKVRKATAAMAATRSYAAKAWQVLTHIARQPGREAHRCWVRPTTKKGSLVVVISGDRGLAGAYNSNVIRHTLQRFDRAVGGSMLRSVAKGGTFCFVEARSWQPISATCLPRRPSQTSLRSAEWW
jgi:ATP synthase F1 gamma subunit